MLHSDAINEIAAALAAAQGEFKAVAKDKTAKAGQYSYKYSDIADVLEMALPVLSKHKLALVQATDVDSGAIILRTRVVHASGQWIESGYPVCSASGQNHQQMGGALTYARRYAASSLLGIASDEDTDAQEAAQPVGRDSRRPQSAPRQQETRQAAGQPAAARDPSPGEKGVKAAMLYAISLAESEADLNDWIKDPKTQGALEALDDTAKDEVRRSWGSKRSDLRVAAQGQQEAA